MKGKYFNGTCQSHYHRVNYLGQNEGTLILVSETFAFKYIKQPRKQLDIHTNFISRQEVSLKCCVKLELSDEMFWNIIEHLALQVNQSNTWR